MKSIWNEIYLEDHKPTLSDIEQYINNKLWLNLNTFIIETYNIKPSLSYSKCSSQAGWNVKYKKSSKSLCTLYPMNGFFIALIVIGSKEIFEADLLIPTCSNYTKILYEKAPFLCGGKWLMMNITDKQILNDAQNLIKIRVKPQKQI